jgi:hypothetical protein
VPESRGDVEIQIRAQVCVLLEQLQEIGHLQRALRVRHHAAVAAGVDLPVLPVEHGYFTATASLHQVVGRPLAGHCAAAPSSTTSRPVRK